MNQPNTEENLHINLWPSGAWTDGDLDEFKKALGEFGPVTGQRTDECRGMGLQTTLCFLAGGVLAGFLARLGEDIYESLRTRLKRLLKTDRQEPSHSTEPDYLTIVGRKLLQDDDIEYVCEFYGADELEIFFLNVGDLHTVLLDPTRNGLGTLPEGHIRGVCAHLCTQDGRQHFAQMRVEWFLGGKTKTTEFPEAPYWMLDANIETKNTWREYVAVVPARSTVASASRAWSGHGIKWRESFDDKG